MIKPLNTPALAAAQPRTGLQNVAELIPQLIRKYEIQAEFARAREQEAAAKKAAMQDAAMVREAKAALFDNADGPWLNEPITMPSHLPTVVAKPVESATQQSFGW